MPRRARNSLYGGPPGGGHGRCSAGFVPYSASSDRRRDRRHTLSGYAVLRSRKWSGTEVFGGVVDVSASGVRLRVKPGTSLKTGEVWAVDLEVALPRVPPAAPPVRLWGCGSVTRVEESEERGTEIAMHFEAPLVVVEGFPVPARPTRATAPARA